MLADIEHIRADVGSLADAETNPERKQKLLEIADHGALNPPPFLAQTFRTLVEQADT